MSVIELEIIRDTVYDCIKQMGDICGGARYSCIDDDVKHILYDASDNMLMYYGKVLAFIGACQIYMKLQMDIDELCTSCRNNIKSTEEMFNKGIKMLSDMTSHDMSDLPDDIVEYYAYIGSMECNAINLKDILNEFLDEYGIVKQ